jgi:hypothetical protein
MENFQVLANRFLVFAGKNYYPLGGFNDCLGGFSRYDECISILRKQQYVAYNFSKLDDKQKILRKNHWQNRAGLSTEVPDFIYEWAYDWFHILNIVNIQIIHSESHKTVWHDDCLYHNSRPNELIELIDTRPKP